MAKLLAVPMFAIFILGFAFATPAIAQWPIYYLTGPLAVTVTMTKIGENAFDFSYGVSPLIEMPTPLEFEPGRFYYYYTWPVGGSGTQITGDFGLVTDYWGIEHDGVYRTEYAFGGAFHFQQAPHEPFSVFASGDLLAVTTGRSNEYAGNWSGTATIWGDVPQLVGESTTWTVTPEPPAWLLCLVGLLPILEFRRRTGGHGDSIAEETWRPHL